MFSSLERIERVALATPALLQRMQMLPAEKIDAELKYLEIAIAKTAGPREEVAWGWLMEKIDAWRAKQE